MQEEYMQEYLPWPNLRVGVEGTLQRPPYSLATGVEWVRGLDAKKGKDEVFAILEKTTKESFKKGRYRYIGHTGVHGITWPDGVAKTGSVIGLAHAQGRGYGTEAKLLLQHHAFHVLGLRKLRSQVKGWNAASLGHLIKCGYRIVGRHRREVFHEGNFVDLIMLEVFREEWEPIWAHYQKAYALPSLTDEQRALVHKETTQ